MAHQMNKNFIGLILLISGFQALSAEQVFIESDEYGQGFITQHLNRCFFVAPFHVVKDSVFLNLVGDDPQRSLGEGQLIQKFGYDLAVGSVEGKLIANCNTHFNSLKGSTDVIESNNTFAISTVNSDGMVSRQNVIAVETNLTHIMVQPVSEEHLLYKGMSGSMLYFDELPLGMLQSIDSQTGFGKVLRFDRLLETVNPFFNGTSTLSATTEKPSATQAAAIGYELVEWSKVSANQSSSPNMVADSDDSTAWVVQLAGDVLELTLAFPASREVSGLTLVSEDQGKATVKNFEVLTSKRAKGKRGWISQASYSTFPQSVSNKVTWLPGNVKRIRVRIFNSWKPDSLVHINTILVH
jgi:hypothetical protein